MATTIKREIGGVEVELRCSALTPILYRNAYKRDLFRDLSAFREGGGELPDGAMEAMLHMAYICAKQATPGIEPEEDWLDRFGLLAAGDIAGAVAALITGDEQTISTPKKKSGRPSAK